MYPLIGILVVFAAVFGGFLLEKGNPYVLMQPAELLIVGGAAAGIITAGHCRRGTGRRDHRAIHRRRPEEVGQKVAAALLGTFLGILLCFGVVGPVAARPHMLAQTDTQLLRSRAALS